jgi:LysR family transcriptional activator of glutamate synthase operon
MELRQLRYLVALADERNFTRAAAREHVAQPALSQQIRKLERELGLALVERTTRRVSITSAGELLVARARMILAELEAALEELQAQRGALTGRVRVGAMHTLGPLDLSGVIAQFHGRHPGVEVAVLEQSSEELADLLRVGEIDLAFLSVTERIERRGLALRRLLSEELVAVVPASHPLAGRQGLELSELAGEEFVSYRRGARLRELLEAAAERAGFAPTITLETNDSRRIIQLVGMGIGVALLPRSDTDGLPPAERLDGGISSDRVAVVPAMDAPPRDITLAWLERRRLAPAAAEFLALSLGTLSRSGGL